MLTARALDAAGNITLSAGIPVTVINATGGTRTLGYSSVGAVVDTGAAQHINAWRFTMPNESGIATSLAVLVANPIGAAPNNQFQVAVYADQNGAPGTLIAASSSQAITPNAWNTAALSATLQPNTGVIGSRTS